MGRMERTDLTQKTTTVVHQEDPRCSQLRAELSLLQQRNSALKQKVQFHDTRIQYGSRNYTHVDEVVEGGVVRQIRKSNKNKQNERVQVMRDGHLVWIDV